MPHALNFDRRYATIPEGFLDRANEGITISRLAVEFGLSAKQVWSRLKKLGISRDLTIDIPRDLLDRFNGGDSVLALSLRYGISRAAINRMLRDLGAAHRTGSEAELLKWKSLKKDPVAVKRQCSAAWRAATGRVKTLEERCLAAVAREKTGSCVNRFEGEVLNAIRDAGFPCTPQKAVGTYSLDIALDELPIAVEVSGHAPKQFAIVRSQQRTKNLLDAGWLVIYVRFKTGGYKNARCNRRGVVIDHMLKQLVPLIERARSDKSVFGCYWVIIGDPEYRPTVDFDFGDLPRVV